MSASEILRKMYLRPAMECGFVAMTEPDSPHSPMQRYVKLLR